MFRFIWCIEKNENTELKGIVQQCQPEDFNVYLSLNISLHILIRNTWRYQRGKHKP